MAEEGKRQSPINIVTDDVVDATADVNKNPLKWTYTDKHCLSVENTGSSWRVNIDGSGSSKFRRIQKKIMQASLQNRGLLPMNMFYVPYYTIVFSYKSLRAISIITCVFQH